MTRPDQPVRVVLFSGGRGAGALVRQLVAREGVSLTIAINGYDDGASTGEVRRFLGDSLGPSDFRKNASRLARQMETCPAALLDRIDGRLDPQVSASSALTELSAIASAWPPELPLARWLRRFVAEYERRPVFDFRDCSIGNIVFAGAYLEADRSFNRAVDAYCELLGLPAGLVENVTDGRNAHLAAADDQGRVLRTEGDMVDARQRNTIRTIFLLDRTPAADVDVAELEALPEPSLGLNPRLAGKLAAADIIIYAPGTQHSSLFPSYLTPGLADAIAANLHAIKLLITNIQADTEITGSTAVDLVNRALYYLKLRCAADLPSPCLITHYLMNDPGRAESAPYVPLGPVELLEDPRLVRIASYEDGVTGLHDAARVLGPFLDAVLAPPRRPRIAVLLHDAGSVNKVSETLLEMVRGHIADQPIDVTVFCAGSFVFAPSFLQRLPFRVHIVADSAMFVERVRAAGFDYVALFESSGMYRGEDLVALSAHLSVGQLDAVWGSRRLSVNDIRDSYRIRYEGNPVMGALSSVGSHLLSLTCLVLYGRYISDTLSAVRAIRADDAIGLPIDLAHKRANQYILSRLLRRRAAILELPVRFTPLSPERVHRTSIGEGLHAVLTLFLLWM